MEGEAADRERGVVPGETSVCLSQPVVPRLESWAEATEAEVGRRDDTFISQSERAAAAPYPELLITGDLVAASPEVLGLRLRSARRSSPTVPPALR